jgi:hypothetical protein
LSTHAQRNPGLSGVGKAGLPEGSPIDLVSGGLALGGTYLLRLTVQGSQITGEFSPDGGTTWALVASVTDTTFASPGYAGVRGWSRVRADDFSVGGVGGSTAGAITINRNAAVTTSTSVTLNLWAADVAGVAGYFLSTDSTPPAPDAPDWVAVPTTASFSTNVSFSLSSGNGTRTVHAWYKNAAGNVSSAASDSILLDPSPPPGGSPPSLTLQPVLAGLSSPTSVAHAGDGTGRLFITQQAGKILRIVVDKGSSYTIPPTNPFLATAGVRPEIWAWGFRNPWRFSLDRLTADLFIGDVGQSAREEVDLQPATSTGGENYGWRRVDGTACFNPAVGCNDGTLVLPIAEYLHGSGDCSITGGYAYRGTAIPELAGRYFCGDFCSGWIWSGMRNAGGT